MRRVGHWLTGLGLVWLLIDRALRHFAPRQWGGPNIGGGFFLLLAHGAIAVGAVFLVGSLFPRPAPSDPRPRRSPLPWVITGTLLALVALGPFLLPSVSFRDLVAGRMGVTVDGAGNPVLVLEICRHSVDRVTLVGPNIDGRNRPLAVLIAPAPVTTTMLLDPLRPPAGWTGAPASLPYATDPDLLHISSGRGAGELSQVSFTRASLAGLDPRTVQYSRWDNQSQHTTDERVPMGDFHALVCDPLLAG